MHALKLIGIVVQLYLQYTKVILVGHLNLGRLIFGTNNIERAKITNTELIINEKAEDFDFIMFIRPDVQINSNFNVNILNGDFDIIIPSYDHHEGYNDRFAILPFKKSLNYACRIDEIIDFRKNHGRIVSEKYVKFIIDKYYNKLKFIDFNMTIIRPDGSKC